MPPQQTIGTGGHGKLKFCIVLSAAKCWFDDK